MQGSLDAEHCKFQDYPGRSHAGTVVVDVDTAGIDLWGKKTYVMKKKIIRQLLEILKQKGLWMHRRAAKWLILQNAGMFITEIIQSYNGALLPAS